MARASYRIFDSQNDTYSQLQRHSDVPTDTKNFMPKKDGTLVVEEDVAKFVVVVQQPEITSPENGTEDFMGTVVLTPYTPGESYAGKQTALRYQLALDEDFEKLVGDHTIVTTSNKFKPMYGHNDELNSENNHEETEHDGVHIIEDFDRSQAKIYVRAKYISDVNSSLWSDYIYYITPDAYPVEPELVLEWEGDVNVPQIVTVEANFHGLSSDSGTPSIELNSTDWILKKEDGTVVFESLNDTTNKTSFKFKDKFETNTTYTLEVKFHTEAGDSDVATITFTTAHAWVELPDGMSFDDMIGDLRAGYLGKDEHGGSSTDPKNVYRYIGEKSRKIGIRSGNTSDTQNPNTDLFPNDVVSYNGVLYKAKDWKGEIGTLNYPKNPDYDISTSEFFEKYTSDVALPNYQTVLNSLASFGIYNREAFTVDNIKYLSDFDFGGVSGKFTRLEPEFGYNYDDSGSHDVTGYFVPTKKGDNTQAWDKGNEWYAVVMHGKVKYVSSVHFKYVSPFELGLCHLTGKGRTIRIGYHLWRVSIMTLEEAYIVNHIFDGKLALESPGYDDADENHITYEIVRNNEDTLTKYDYVRFGKHLDVVQFDPLSARLLENDDTGKKYYPAYRLVLEHIPESEEPWKEEYLNEINNGPKAVLPSNNTGSNDFKVTTLASNETFVYDKFTDTGYFGIVSGADLFTTNEINSALTMEGEKVDFEQEWHKFYYHGKIIYIPMFMVRYNTTWNSIMNTGWYGSTPYSHVINKPVLNKNGKYFVGGLQSMSIYLLTGGLNSSASDNYANYFAASRSMYVETLLRTLPGFHSGNILNKNNEYLGSSEGFSSNIIASRLGCVHSGNMQIGFNFVDSKQIYTQNKLSSLPNYSDVFNSTAVLYNKMSVLGSSIFPYKQWSSNGQSGTSVSNTIITPTFVEGAQSTVNGNVLVASSYMVYNYTQYINGGTFTLYPFGSMFQHTHSTFPRLDDSAYNDFNKHLGYFAFTPFLEQISEYQKSEIDDFNESVKTNVVKMEKHNTKVEEHRALQAALEKIEAEYLAKIEKEGIDERFEGNIRTPMIIEPNALTAPTNGEPVSVSTLTGSKYIVGKSFRGEHTGTDVEWALDEAFTNKVASMSVDGNSTRVTVNKSLITNEDHFDTPVYARIRYKSNNVTSDWSEPVTGQISAVPPIPDISLPFKKDRPGTPKTVSSAAYFIKSFTYYGHVEEDRLSPYGVNRGTIDPETSPFPILLQLGDRFVYKPDGKAYRVVLDGGSTIADVSKPTINGYINHTAKANFINDVTVPYGDIQFRPAEDGDVKFGYTAAWWGWYIGNLNVIINPTSNEQDRPELKDNYLVAAKKQPTKTTVDIQFWSPNAGSIMLSTNAYSHPIPQVYKNIFPWIFPGGYTQQPQTASDTINLKNQVNSLTAFVNVNEFLYFDNDDNMKLIYAPNIPIGDNVNFWYVALNYNAYEGQHTVRLGDYLFYKRLPYVDEVKCMADADALANFSGSILTLDGPSDNFANSGNIPDKDIVATIIKNGKFVGTENKTRNDGLLYMPVLEFIPEEEESKLFNSKLGNCDYDKEINIGFYKNDNVKVENSVQIHSDPYHAITTYATLSNTYFHYQGIDTWYRSNNDLWKVPSPDNVNTINAAFVRYNIMYNELTGYAIPSYTISGITNIIHSPRMLVRSEPRTFTYNNIKWSVCMGKWQQYPCLNYKDFGCTDNHSGGFSTYYKQSRTNINCTYSILTMFDTEFTVIPYMFSNSGPNNWPYYPKAGRRNVIVNASNIDSNRYLNTFPFIYSYLLAGSSPFDPSSYFYTYCVCNAALEIYRALK